MRIVVLFLQFGKQETAMMKSILDPTFKYVPAVATDVRATFERIRRERAGPETSIKLVCSKTANYCVRNTRNPAVSA